MTGEWVNMMDAGIIDPVKVTRSALQNAASVANKRFDDRNSGCQQTRTSPPAMPQGMDGMGYGKSK